MFEILKENMATEKTITLNDILQIKPGTFKNFVCATPMQCRSVQSMVNYAKRFHKPYNVGNYTTKADFDNCIVTVTALPKIKISEAK